MFIVLLLKVKLDENDIDRRQIEEEEKIFFSLFRIEWKPFSFWLIEEIVDEQSEIESDH